MPYNPVTEQVVAALVAIVGQANVLTEAERLEGYAHDETDAQKYGRMPDVVVTPTSTEQVAAVVRLANQERIPVTPRGAGSGLSGGAIPVFGGIVLSVEKMNRIIEVDRANMLLVAETGIVTNEINERIKDEGLFYAGYPMSLETCFLGGNIGANAGGGKAVKYGVTGRYVLGLELVTPQGEVVWLGGKLCKDVTGYDLKQLVVGSEGTLGIVTQAILRLTALPTACCDLLVLFSSVAEAIACVPKILASGILPTGIEFMDRLSVQTSCRYLNESLPYEDCGAMLLIEVDGSDQDQVERDAERIGDLCLKEQAIEVYVADNHTTQERVWSVRRNIAEAFKAASPIQSVEDIVVPISAIPAIMPELERIAQAYQIQIPCYGHAGDGNLHATLVKNPESSLEHWHEIEPLALGELYAAAQKLGGKISGEHGIGLKRRDFLKQTMDPVEYNLMAAIKQAWDPAAIMNPGKLFTSESE